MLQPGRKSPTIAFSAIILLVVFAGILVAYADDVGAGAFRAAAATATPTLQLGERPYTTATPFQPGRPSLLPTPTTSLASATPTPASHAPGDDQPTPAPIQLLPTSTMSPASSPTPLGSAFTALPAPVPLAGATPVHPGLAKTDANIHVGLAFNSYVTNYATEKGAVDLVWGSNVPDQPTGVVNLAYAPATRIGPGPNFQLPYTTSWFLTNHPDWIAYACDRQTIAYEFGEPNTPLDVYNPAVIAFLMQVEYIPLLQAGYAGIGFDNVELTNKWNRCGHYDAQHNWVAEFTGQGLDPHYTQTIVQWGQMITQAIHAYQATAIVGMNFYFDFAQQNASLQLMSTADLLSDERSFTDWGRTPPSVPFNQHWLDYMSAMQQYLAAGGALFLINEEPTTTPTIPQKQWVLANYLLLKGHYTYLAIVGQQQYGQYYDKPEYHLNIGTPTTGILTDGCIYLREFTKGIAIVNPSSSITYTAVLPARHYADLYGNPVGNTFNLPPGSGIVLLYRP